MCYGVEDCKRDVHVVMADVNDGGAFGMLFMVIVVMAAVFLITHIS